MCPLTASLFRLAVRAETPCGGPVRHQPRIIYKVSRRTAGGRAPCLYTSRDDTNTEPAAHPRNPNYDSAPTALHVVGTQRKHKGGGEDK